MWLGSRARLALNQKQKYFSLPDHQLAENFILILISKWQKEDKREFVTKLVGIIVTTIFM